MKYAKLNNRAMYAPLLTGNINPIKEKQTAIEAKVLIFLVSELKYIAKENRKKYKK